MSSNDDMFFDSIVISDSGDIKITFSPEEIIKTLEMLSFTKKVYQELILNAESEFKDKENLSKVEAKYISLLIDNSNHTDLIYEKILSDTGLTSEDKTIH